MIYGDRRKIYFFIMTAFEQFVAPLYVLLAEFIGCDRHPVHVLHFFKGLVGFLAENVSTYCIRLVHVIFVGSNPTCIGKLATDPQ